MPDPARQTASQVRSQWFGEPCRRLTEYHIKSRWTLQATREEVAAIFIDGTSLARWWPSTWLCVDVLENGEAMGAGRVYGVRTKGWYPYTLRFRFRIDEAQYPERFSLVCWGDFVGRGSCFTRPHGRLLHVHWDWQIRVRKPLLQFLSSFCKPLLIANHRWCMARGEESLTIELARRRGENARSHGHANGPPGPTFLGLRRLFGCTDINA